MLRIFINKQKREENNTFVNLKLLNYIYKVSLLTTKLTNTIKNQTSFLYVDKEIVNFETKEDELYHSEHLLK